ncbi:hypothetical protein ACFSSB_03555 [Lacinutrix gracilariae]|uniref:Uncharacterized protein n=1 Tax=Lacinutrix gracilariae TaxID=1747198 RepID=A0ABW5JXZ9_9FLAO
MKKKNKKKSKDQESTVEKKRNTHLYWIAILGVLGPAIGFLWNYESDRKDEKHAAEITELKTKISSIEKGI